MAALKSDNMLWRLHAQRLLVERGKLDVVPQLVALTRDRTVDAIGINGARVPRAVDAARPRRHHQHHERGRPGRGAGADASGRRRPQGRGDGAAGDARGGPATTAAILDARILADTDLHTRLAAILRLAELPASDAAGKAIYAASLEPSNFGDRWLSRALYIAASRHKAPFLTQYRDDPAKLAVDALPIAPAPRARPARLAAARRGRARRRTGRRWRCRAAGSHAA